MAGAASAQFRHQVAGGAHERSNRGARRRTLREAEHLVHDLQRIELTTAAQFACAWSLWFPSVTAGRDRGPMVLRPPARGSVRSCVLPERHAARMDMALAREIQRTEGSEDTDSREDWLRLHWHRAIQVSSRYATCVRIAAFVEASRSASMRGASITHEHTSNCPSELYVEVWADRYAPEATTPTSVCTLHAES